MFYLIARMAELVYAHDLKSCLARDVGSIPTPGTKTMYIVFEHESKVVLRLYVGNRKTERVPVEHDWSRVADTTKMSDGEFWVAEGSHLGHK